MSLYAAAGLLGVRDQQAGGRVSGAQNQMPVVPASQVVQCNSHTCVARPGLFAHVVALNLAVCRRDAPDPVQPGRPERMEYEQNGTTNLFMTFELLASQAVPGNTGRV